MRVSFWFNQKWHANNKNHFNTHTHIYISSTTAQRGKPVITARIKKSTGQSIPAPTLCLPFIVSYPFIVLSNKFSLMHSFNLCLCSCVIWISLYGSFPSICKYVLVSPSSKKENKTKTEKNPFLISCDPFYTHGFHFFISYYLPNLPEWGSFPSTPLKNSFLQVMNDLHVAKSKSHLSVLLTLAAFSPINHHCPLTEILLSQLLNKKFYWFSFYFTSSSSSE